MADQLSREERVAAGYKKLKRFQQRANKKGSEQPRKKTSKENSPMTLDEKPLEKSTIPAREDQTVKINSPVPTIPPKRTSHNSSSQENLTSSSTLYNSESRVSDRNHLPEDRSKLSDSATKSKSDLDLVSIKELSSTESLRQISQQINGLMSETHAFLNGSIEQEDETSTSQAENSSLERRNQQLASQIDQLQQSNDHFQFQLQEAKAKNTRLQREFEQERQNLQEKAHKEQVELKDQLQVHIQTIGLLVAEKTALQSSLSLSQQTAKQKAAEVEELQGRLRASRQRANDLERELNNLSTSNQQFEKGNKESSKEIDRLKLDNYKLSKSLEDVKQQNAELSEKLSKKISECKKFESELSEASSKLSLAEVYANQISEGNYPENSSQLEELHHQKLELEKQVSLHKESVDKLITERDQMSEQYQLYVHELSQQVTSLRDELKQLASEKEILVKEKNNLIEKIEDLEKKQDMDSTSKEDSEKVKTQITLLEKQNEELKKKLESQVSDNAQMSNLVLEKESRISELETSLHRLKEEEVDKSRLLETMQSDKVAAKRAVSQNIELKKQLAELQNGFVLMSNDKLQLTEKLLSEQHITKELGERLSQQEEELLELKEQLTDKENQLKGLEVSNTKGLFQQSQIADRMRHYEAQGQLAEMLQQELNQAKERLSNLVKQNTELRMALARQVEKMSPDGSSEDKDAEKRNDLVASLSTSVCQLEMERNQMMKQLDEQKTLRTKFEEQMKQKENQLNHGNDSAISEEEHEMLKNAMKQLEERFKKTMNEIAELTDEKQKLEHLVLQLQGETDTIGDYIALYQIQRGLMRKRATEKDEYIAQLARDREDLKTKLGELQNLVMRLLDERKLYQSQGIIALDSAADLIEINKSLARAENTDSNVSAPKTESLLAAANAEPYVNGENSEKQENTAKKIMDLLTEIGTTNLIEKPVVDNFHPCPVCSGRLITV